MNEKTFAELYCEQNQIDPSCYEREVLARALYPQAKLIRWILLAQSNLMAADWDFVRGVGGLRRFRDFDFEAQEYAHHPANRGFWRMSINLRVSSRALRRMVRETLHADRHAAEDAAADDTAVPFKEPPGSKSDPKHRSG
jgi:hypothetical protein